MISKPTGLFPDSTVIDVGQGALSGKNLFTSNGAIGGAIIKCPVNNYGSGSNGGLITDYEDVWGSEVERQIRRDIEYCWRRFYVSAYIPVKENYNYIISGYKTTKAYTFDTEHGANLVFAWYDTNKNYLSYTARNRDYETITAPSNAAYLRLGFYKSINTDEEYEESTLKIQETARYSDGLRFQYQLLSGSDVETITSNSEKAYATLILWYKDRYYHFPFTDQINTDYAPKINKGKDFMTVTLDIPNNLSNGYYYKSTTGIWGMHVMNFVNSDVSIASILKTGKSYRWKLRLYEKGSILNTSGHIPDECIGYGTVQDVSKVCSNETDSSTLTGYNFKVFPHTNIYDYVAGSSNKVPMTDGRDTLYSSCYDVSDCLYEIYRCYDNNIKYWLRASGEYLPITTYRFYPYTYDTKSAQQGNLATLNGLYYNGENSCFDDYGNPLHGYAIIDKAAPSTYNGNDNHGNISTNVLNAQNEFQGETYSIMTNYIENEWGCFELYDTPALSLTDNTGLDISNTAEMSPAILSYGIISINATYSQGQGIDLEYYSYKIYSKKADSRDEFVLDYASDIYYNKNISLEYDRVLGDREYKVCLTVTDATQRTVDRTVYYKTDGLGVMEGLANASYYRPHNSIIIDWSEVDWSDTEINISNIKGWRVFKKMGDRDRLYEVADLSAENSNIIEDFVIGDNCAIQYYIYPLGTVSGHTVLYTPLVTDAITLQEGTDKLLGLKQIDDKVYEVVDNQVWRLWLNLEDNGFTYNTDKNFYDTFNRYNQETVGNRQYITKSVGGMLGYIDCAHYDEGIIDTYDMLVSWNEFTGSPNLKCLVDARGLVLPGNFETNPTVEYDDTMGAYATAKFNWRQLADLDVIKIYAKSLPFNLTKGTFLLSSDGYYLTAPEEVSEEDVVLYTTE